MENFIAVVKSTDGKIDKYKDFVSKSDADAHVVTYGGFVVDKPDRERMDYWVVDADKKTLTYDEVSDKSDEVKVSFDRLRQDRNRLLAATDYLALKDITLSNDMKAYRKALRDLPATLNNTTVLETITWPTKP